MIATNGVDTRDIHHAPTGLISVIATASAGMNPDSAWITSPPIASPTANAISSVNRAAPRTTACGVHTA